MKTLLKALFFLSIAMIAIVLIAPSFINWNSYRPQLETQIENALGRDVKLGKIDIQLLPTPFLIAHDVTVKNNADQNVFALEKLRLKLLKKPLLEGRIQFATLYMDGPHWQIHIVKNSEKQKDKTAGKALKSRAVSAISFDEIIIKNGRIAYRNDISGQQFDIDKIDLKLVADSVFGPVSLNGGMALNGIKMKLEAGGGRYEAGQPLPLHLAMETISEQSAALNFNGILSLAEKLELQGEVTINSDTADMSALQRAFGTLGRLWPAQGVVKSARSFLTADGQNIRFEDIDIVQAEGSQITGEASVTYQQDRASKITAELQFDDYQLAQDASWHDINWPQDVSGSLKLAIKNLHYGREKQQLNNVNANISIGGKDIEFIDLNASLAANATIQAAGGYDLGTKVYDLAVQLQVPDMEGFLASFGDSDMVDSLSFAPLDGLTMDTDVIFGLDQLKLNDMVVQADDVLSFHGTINRGDKKQVIEGAFKTLDLPGFGKMQKIRQFIKALGSARDTEFDLVFQKLRLHGGIGNAIQLAGVLESKTVDLKRARGNVFGANLEVNGKIADVGALKGIDLGFKMTANTPETFFKQAGFNYPKGLKNKGTMHITGQMTGAAQALELTADVKTDHLNWNRALPLTDLVEALSVNPKMTLNLSAKDIISGDMALSNPVVVLNIDDAGVAFSDMTAGIWDGQVKGEGALLRTATKDWKVETDLAFTAIGMKAPIWKRLPILNAKALDMNVTLSGQDADLLKAREKSAGVMTLSMAEAQWPAFAAPKAYKWASGLDLVPDNLAAKVKSRLVQSELLSPAFALEFTVDQGYAEIEEAQVYEEDGIAVTLSGGFSMATDNFNYSADVQPTAEDAAPGFHASWSPEKSDVLMTLNISALQAFLDTRYQKRMAAEAAARAAAEERQDLEGVDVAPLGLPGVTAPTADTSQTDGAGPAFIEDILNTLDQEETEPVTAPAAEDVEAETETETETP